MRYVAAYFLCSLTGKEPIVADVEKILSSVGIDSDDAKIKKVFKELENKNIQDLLASGRERLATMPIGGGAVASAVPVPAEAAGTPVVEEKKEEKKFVKEEEEESDDDMGFGLFD